MAGGGVLDGNDGAADRGLNGGVFKGEIGVGIEGAVLQYQPLAVAERLRAADAAADKAEILGVPAEVLAVDVGIVHRHVLGLPESIFRVKLGVADHDVAGILEGIITLLFVTVNVDILAVHEDVVGLGRLHIPQADAAAVPEGLSGIRNADPFERHVGNPAEHLRGLHQGIIHPAALGVPERSPGAVTENAVADSKAAGLPEGILAPELTADGLDVGAFLQRGLSRPDGHVLYAEAVAGIQGAFPLKVLVSNDFHLTRSSPAISGRQRG